MLSFDLMGFCFATTAERKEWPTFWMNGATAREEHFLIEITKKKINNTWRKLWVMKIDGEQDSIERKRVFMSPLPSVRVGLSEFCSEGSTSLRTVTLPVLARQQLGASSCAHACTSVSFSAVWR